ncbi:MAG: ABC transporter permease [Pseudomonadota bacterium]
MTAVVRSLNAQARIVWAVALREMMLRHRESPLGVLTAIIEPLAMILLMTLVFSTIRLRIPGAGDYVMLFIMTGILPITMFRGGVQGCDRGVARQKRALVVPGVRPLDLMLGGLIVNYMTLLALFTLITAFFALIYRPDSPQNFVVSLLPGVCNALMAIGVGAINLLIKSWFKFWGTIFAIITMPLNIISGMFYTADTLPTAVLKYLYYNPFFHATEFTRTHYFPDYTSDFFDPYYYFGCTFGFVFLGLLVERVFRYRLAMGT